MGRRQKTYGYHPREKRLNREKNVSKTKRKKNYYKNRKLLPNNRIAL